MTNLHQVQSVGDQLITPGVSSTTATRSVSTDGSVYNVLLTGGVQWDAGSKVKVGGRITSPGIRIGGSSKLLYSQIVFSGAGSREIGFRDEDAKLDYKIPVELTGGIAFLFDHFSLKGTSAITAAPVPIPCSPAVHWLRLSRPTPMACRPSPRCPSSRSGEG
jgi:hypothetical protein